MQVASRQCLWKDTIVWSCTMLVVEASEECMTVHIARGELASGSSSVTISWGDGTKSEYSRINDAQHTYAKRGEYLIVISDDICTFGYSTSIGESRVRDMLRELVALGSKVEYIGGYAFNNCQRMRGVVNLPNVTSIGGYAFGSTLGITDFVLPSLKRLLQTAFYTGPSATRMYADNVNQIDSRFWEYYGVSGCGSTLQDLYLRNSTCAQIKAMAGFPFWADKIGMDVRFHGADGIVLKDGSVIPN